MIEVNGKYNSAKIFTDNVEQTALGQIISLCNQEFVKDSKIRIMPDTHAGAGCTIGTTMTITDKIVPNLVGVDIGCGMEVSFFEVKKDEINFDKLDQVIRKQVPSGFNIRGSIHHYAKQITNLKDVRAPFNFDRAQLSIGTLGGGNHFIEVNETSSGYISVVIHSGSRNLGKQIAEYYQKRAYDELTSVKHEKDELIKKLQKEGRHSEIETMLKSVKSGKVNKDFAYLQGKGFEDYMHDMKIAQKYAEVSRKAMMAEIISGMGWTEIGGFTTIHNYIDMENMILRKGAISAQSGEIVIIPINMRDGSIIARGKGNADWNFSGPHGAGRLMSRSKAKELVNLDEFKDTMKDIWTTSVNQSTLDESPFAYKPIEEILDNVGESVDIVDIIKPLYNFKASE
jgi:tRNA-splicing ligase RtcB